MKRYDVVLGIFLTRRGVAFVLFEGPHSPTHWGHVRRASTQDHGNCLKRASRLLARQPSVLVLEDTSWTGTRRSRRVCELNNAIFDLADQHGIPVCAFSRDRVRAAFGHLAPPTRYSIAREIAKNIPVFEHHLPPPRKPWLPEHERMGVFDAAALVLTYFQNMSGDQSRTT